MRIGKHRIEQDTVADFIALLALLAAFAAIGIAAAS